MLQHFVVAVGGVMVLVAAWVLVQSLARRSMHEPPEDGDVLSCGLCGVSRACHCGRVDRPPSDNPVSRDEGLGSAHRRSANG